MKLLQSPPTAQKRARSAAFTLIEVIIVGSVLTIGLMAMALTSVASSSLHRTSQEVNQAENMVRAITNLVQSVSETAKTSNGGWSQTLVDSFQPGASPGQSLPSRKLKAADGTPATVTILVITDETQTDEQLGVKMGMPRDLNGDNLVDNTDVSGTATLLPVIIQLQWNGVSGTVRFNHGFYLLGI
ncbi:MAG: hypothetical protein GY930_15475 [bacterium]|nr:hypothetical protein [bacterium]